MTEAPKLIYVLPFSADWKDKPMPMGDKRTGMFSVNREDYEPDQQPVEYALATPTPASAMSEEQLELDADEIASYIATFDENQSALAKQHNKRMMVNLAKRYAAGHGGWCFDMDKAPAGRWLLVCDGFGTGAWMACSNGKGGFVTLHDMPVYQPYAWQEMPLPPAPNKEG